MDTPSSLFGVQARPRSGDPPTADAAPERAGGGEGRRAEMPAQPRARWVSSPGDRATRRGRNV